jgi:oligopeptide/dipeptide ABC transporter ATP-binding protein
VSSASDDPLLDVRGLSVNFATDGGLVRALDDVSFDVRAGQAVALVGESGCGKTVTALSLMRLLPPSGKIERGAIVLGGRDLARLSEREMQDVRGGQIGMVFQEPMTSLNPVYSVGAQIAEAVRLHRPVSRAAAKRRALELLGRVGFPRPEERIDAYPHELSGGMRQRVMIAIALACEPPLLLADEPTTALDATVQAQILKLLKTLQEELEMALLLIAHDLSLVGAVTDEIVVLYAGQVAERGPTREVLASPRHPYTRALLRSIPPTDGSAFREPGTKGRRLPTIAGSLPDLRYRPSACRFVDRCPEAFDRCRDEAPPLYGPPPRAVRCFLHAPDRTSLGRTAEGGAA